MNKLKQLRQALHDLKTEGRDKLSKANALEDKTDLSAEDEKDLAALNTRLDEIEAALPGLEADITAEEKRLDRDAMFAPATGGGDDAASQARATVTVTSDEPDPRTTGGFASIGDFALTVKGATSHDAGAVGRLNAMYQAAPTNYHQEQGASEGYMVPAAFRDQIWDLVYTGGDLINRVDLEPTESNAVELLADEDTPWGSTGITANWRGEGTQMSADKLSTNNRLVKLHELYCFALATDELLEDAPRLADRLTRKAAQAIRWKASDAVAYGTGAGQPMGYFNSGALVSVAKESGQAADTINATNVLKMFSRLLRVDGSMPFWLANSDTLPQLGTRTIGDQPSWTPPSTGLRDAPGGFLLGAPVLLSEHAKTLGDKGDLQLVDPMGYYATQKTGGTKFDTSIHLFFDYGMQAFRWTFRMGGTPFLSAPVSPANGSNTKSHFVTLAERA